MGFYGSLPWHVVRVFVVFVEVAAVALQLRVDATPSGILVVRFAVVPYRVLIGEGYLLAGTFDPIARRGYQIVRVVFAELVYRKKGGKRSRSSIRQTNASDGQLLSLGCKVIMPLGSGLPKLG